MVRQASLAATRGTVRAYIATLPGPHRAVVECTGMWYWIRDVLVPQGVGLRVSLVPEAHMISPAQRETRDLLRARPLLVSRAIQVQQSIRALLEKYNVGPAAELPDLPRIQAELHAEQRALLAVQIRRLERELRDRVLATPDAQRQVWIPGIGKVVA
ncbi:MAG TPA: hypothetical protein VNL96_10220 [Gemmatimonadaceae bacterium]|nr:hypothetical protein [Gemmatimonadaceae bacterium]